MIEENPEPAEDPAEPIEEPDIEEPRPKSPWKAFILTGLIASLIGAAGGGYGVYAGLKHFSPQAKAQPQVDLSPLEATLDRLANRVTAAERQVETLKSRPVTEAEPVDLSDIKKRIAALENAPSPEIDPSALSALQAAQEDGFEWPDVSTLEERIAALETESAAPVETAVPDELLDRLASLEAEIETVKTVQPDNKAVSEIVTKSISDINTRLSALENRPAPAPTIERVSILAFPKTQMMDAVEANMEGGLLKKTLSRHIRVKDNDDPLTLIEGIEADISEGRLAAAAKKFERLPSPVRAAGQAWYDSVKASL